MQKSYSGLRLIPAVALGGEGPYRAPAPSFMPAQSMIRSVLHNLTKLFRMHKPNVADLIEQKLASDNAVNLEGGVLPKVPVAVSTVTQIVSTVYQAVPRGTGLKKMVYYL